MKRIATTLAVTAAAVAALAAPSGASAAETNLDCEKAFVGAIPGFAVGTATYTVEHGEPPFIGGPFYPC